MNKTNWAWCEADVDVQKEHIELRYGNAETSSYQQWLPVALIGRPANHVFSVRWLLPRPVDPEIISRVGRELDFYLVEHPKNFSHTGHPWDYAIYHCTTAANMYSNVHWSHFPKRLSWSTWRTLKHDPRRALAYLAELHHQGDMHRIAAAIFGDDDITPALKRFAADALEGKFEPTENHANIVRAYSAASVARLKRTDGGISFDALLVPEKSRAKEDLPTVAELKAQFRRLFPKLTPPSQQAIAYVLGRACLPCRRDKPGPRGPWNQVAKEVARKRRK